MKTANDVIGDLEQLVAKLCGEIREAGERTDRLRDERDTARLALREAKCAPGDVQLDVEAAAKEILGPAPQHNYPASSQAATDMATAYRDSLNRIIAILLRRVSGKGALTK